MGRLRPVARVVRPRTMHVLSPHTNTSPATGFGEGILMSS